MSPLRLYRVHSASSFTVYDEQHGFEARGHYLMDPSHWINKGRFESHLRWEDRPLEPTPFISLFDNFGT